MPKRVFDILGPIYDFIIKGNPFNVLIDYLKLTNNCKEKILEVGAGTGKTMQLLSPYCDSLWLIDPSAQMLQKARSKLPDATILHGYVEDLPFTNAFFDRVLAVDSFHHWDDHDQGLLEIFRVLKPEGFFIIIEIDPTTRTGHFIKSMEKILRMGSIFYTPREMRALHRKVGFRILKQKYLDEGTYITVSSPLIKTD